MVVMVILAVCHRGLNLNILSSLAIVTNGLTQTPHTDPTHQPHTNSTHQPTHQPKGENLRHLIVNPVVVV